MYQFLYGTIDMSAVAPALTRSLSYSSSATYSRSGSNYTTTGSTSYLASEAATFYGNGYIEDSVSSYVRVSNSGYTLTLTSRSSNGSTFRSTITHTTGGQETYFTSRKANSITYSQNTSSTEIIYSGRTTTTSSESLVLSYATSSVTYARTTGSVSFNGSVPVLQTTTTQGTSKGITSTFTTFSREALGFSWVEEGANLSAELIPTAIVNYFVESNISAVYFAILTTVAETVNESMYMTGLLTPQSSSSSFSIPSDLYKRISYGDSTSSVPEINGEDYYDYTTGEVEVVVSKISKISSTGSYYVPEDRLPVTKTVEFDHDKFSQAEPATRMVMTVSESYPESMKLTFLAVEDLYYRTNFSTYSIRNFDESVGVGVNVIEKLSNLVNYNRTYESGSTTSMNYTRKWGERKGAGNYSPFRFYGFGSQKIKSPYAVIREEIATHGFASAALPDAKNSLGSNVSLSFTADSGVEWARIGLLDRWVIYSYKKTATSGTTEVSLGHVNITTKNTGTSGTSSFFVSLDGAGGIERSAMETQYADAQLFPVFRYVFAQSCLHYGYPPAFGDSVFYNVIYNNDLSENNAVLYNHTGVSVSSGATATGTTTALPVLPSLRFAPMVGTVEMRLKEPPGYIVHGLPA